jgi:hypothetical protein
MNNITNGAQMLPSFCPFDSPEGEKEVFRMLKNDPGCKGWIVLHSLDIAEHVRNAQGEADFVVLIPDQGIVVIEVKSHNSIRYTDQGWWLGNKNEKRGPFKQASEALHSIRKYLEQRNLSSSLPMVSAVIFTSSQFSEDSPEWHDWQVLDKQGLYARDISKNFLRIIHSAREYFATKNLVWMRNGFDASWEKLTLVSQVLRPRFEVLASPSERRKQLQASLKQCTDQQIGILDSYSDNPRMLVTGLAGTGKTTLALEVVRREKVATPSAIVGFFCFNRLLGSVLERECLPLGNGIRTGSFHSWMLAFSGSGNVKIEDRDSKFWNHELPEICLNKLTTPGMQTGFLDLLVLDEAQDLFHKPYLDIFALLLKGGLTKGRWRIFGDFEHQDIYHHGSNPMKKPGEKKSKKEWFYNDIIDEKCALKTLSDNCRNTQEISAAIQLHAQLKPGYSRVLRGDSRHDPEIVFYNTNEDQITSVLKLIDCYLAEGFKASEIILLSPFKDGCLARNLCCDAKWRSQLKEFALDPITLTFSTIHAFKGLESSVVILTDINRLASYEDRDLLYVGMSRALHRLAILCHGSTKDEILKSCFL